MLERQYVTVTLHVGQYPDRTHLETPGGMEFFKKVSLPGTGFPFYVVLSGQGDVIGDAYRRYANGAKPKNNGYPFEVFEMKFFLDLLAKTSKLKEPELKRIESVLKARRKLFGGR